MTRTARILRVGGGGAAIGLVAVAIAALHAGSGGGDGNGEVTLPAPAAASQAAAPTAAAFQAAEVAGASTSALAAPASSSTQPGTYVAAPTDPPATADVRQRLDADPNRSTWATVEQAIAARATPSASGRVIGRITTRTPEGTTGDVLLLERAVVKGQIWLRVSLPILPNGQSGWVPRAALGSYHYVTTRVVIDTRKFKLTLYDHGHVVFTAPVGVGEAATPTPAGKFYIRDMLAGFSGAAFYGPVAFGTSARSAVLTDWPDGGYIGIHGTDTPDIIPGRVSHGCVRLRNPDIIRLARLMPIGTPVTIT